MADNFSIIFLTRCIRMASSDSCSCTWKLAGQQPVSIPASQLSSPVLSPHAVLVRVLAGDVVSFPLCLTVVDSLLILYLGRVCSSKCYLEPAQQQLSSAGANVKFIVQLKDEYENAVDFLSLLANQRQQQHQLLCYPGQEGGSTEIFFAFARYGNFRNIPLQMQTQFPNFTITHERSRSTESTVSIVFAVNSGIDAMSYCLHRSYFAFSQVAERWQRITAARR